MARTDVERFINELGKKAVRLKTSNGVLEGLRRLWNLQRTSTTTSHSTRLKVLSDRTAKENQIETSLARLRAARVVRVFRP